MNTLYYMLHLLRKNHQAFLWSIKQWKESPLFHVVITTTLTIGLLIPMSLVTMIHIMNQYHPIWHYAKQSSVYIKPHTSASKLNNIIDDLKQKDSIKSLNIIPAKTGLKRMSELIQMPSLNQHMNEDMIPILIQINFKTATSLDTMNRITTQIKQRHTAIELIRINQTWMKQTENILQIVQYVLYSMLILITWLMIVTLYCCMKQLLMSQQKYVKLLQLLGASKYTIRRYFYYISIEMTLCAALVATLLSNYFLSCFFRHLSFIIPAFSLVNFDMLIRDSNQYQYGLGICLVAASSISYVATAQLIKSNQDAL